MQAIHIRYSDKTDHPLARSCGIFRAMHSIAGYKGEYTIQFDFFEFLGILIQPITKTFVGLIALR